MIIAEKTKKEFASLHFYHMFKSLENLEESNILSNLRSFLKNLKANPLVSFGPKEV
jgi:hypothetical protein